MASWMVHLRVADRLLDCFEGIAPTEFVMGNIAPDSGLPNEDWTAYFPDRNVSHFQVQDPDGTTQIRVEDFVSRYFTPALRRGYPYLTEEEADAFVEEVSGGLERLQVGA